MGVGLIPLCLSTVGVSCGGLLRSLGFLMSPFLGLSLMVIWDELRYYFQSGDGRDQGIRGIGVGEIKDGGLRYST